MGRFQQEDFQKILDKWLAGTASPEELSFLQNYYKAFELRPDILDRLSAAEQQFLEKDIRHRINEQLNFKAEEKRRKIRRYWIAGSAAVAAAITAAFFLLPLLRTSEPDKVIASNTEATISYPRKSNFIDLPDGTLVVLSAGSNIEYSRSYAKDAKREIFLTGEAYFDVKTVPGRPFVVHTGKLTTTVLGTAFTIRDMPGDSNITVTVSRGKVKLEDPVKNFGVLEKNQQLVYYKEKETASQTMVDVDKDTRWKREGLLLDNVTLASAAQLLKDRFGVNIIVEDEILREQRFTTTIDEDEELEPVIKSISRFNNAQYFIDKEKNTITITPYENQLPD